MSATENIAKMRAEGSKDATKNPSPSGEVEKAIEDHWINCMALAIRACNPAVNGDEIRAGLDKADAELRAFITTYAEDNERLRATVETLQFGERMHNERAEAAQAEIERLRAERNDLDRRATEYALQVNDQALKLAASQAQAEEMRKALEAVRAEIEPVSLGGGWTYQEMVTRAQIAVAMIRTALMKGGE